MILKGCLSVVIAMVRQYVQKRSDQVQILACDIRYLEDRAYSLTNELSSGLDGFFMILDENWDFSCTWRFEYSGELRYCLLQNLRWANIDFGYDNHHRHIECQSNTQVLSKSIH